jgi:hypothetical protein
LKTRRRFRFNSSTPQLLNQNQNKIMESIISGLLKMFGATGPVVIVLVMLAIFILPQAIRILRDFPPRQIAGREGAGLDFSHPHRGQDGEDGSARGDD